MRKLKIAYFFLCGLVSGIFLAQGLIVLAGRSGGNIGGEIFVMPLIGLLIYMGVMIGRMFPEERGRQEKRATGEAATSIGGSAREK